MLILLTLLLIMFAVELVLSFINVLPFETLILNVFNVVTSPDSILNSGMYSLITAGLALASASAIILGTFRTDNSQVALGAGLAGLTIVFLADFTRMASYMYTHYPNNPFSYMVGFLFGLFSLAFLFGIVDWWRGTQ